MASTRHNPPALRADDTTLLDAARESILAVGWRRTTLTDVARRAGVSRMTLYRRWPDMQTLLADLLVREWSALLDESLLGVDSIARGVEATVKALRDNDLLRRILSVDPELLLPYLLDRRGRNQDQVLLLLEQAVTAGQAAGFVRAGNPAVLARTLLLAAQGFVISPATMADVPLEQLDRELAVLIERYLRP